MVRVSSQVDEGFSEDTRSLGGSDTSMTLDSMSTFEEARQRAMDLSAAERAGEWRVWHHNRLVLLTILQNSYTSSPARCQHRSSPKMPKSSSTASSLTQSNIYHLN